MIKRVIFFVVVILAVSTGVFFDLKKVSDKKENTTAGGKRMPGVSVVQTRRGTVSRKLELTGTVSPYRMARLASPASGPVIGINTREGQTVKAGDVLVVLGRRQGVDAQVAALREELKKEELALSRTQQLFKHKASAQRELDLAIATYEKVKAALADAEESSRDYMVKAPWDGVVCNVLVKEGDFIVPKATLLETLVEMYDPASLQVAIYVPEKYALDVNADKRVELRLDAYPGQTLSGKIINVYPYLDERLRTRKVELTISNEVKLLPGMFARVSLLLETVADAILVPAGAVLVLPDGGRGVFVVEDGKAKLKRVKTGIEEGGQAQIVSGLEDNATVVAAGNERLRDGMELRVLNPPVPAKGGDK